ncbi:hypothetical protein OIO90_002574 [Microbotryomycetes sp. JL221]|nr:hypothetical protein OIO90_002574 [Microbotryomycetes sp. JL221]
MSNPRNDLNSECPLLALPSEILFSIASKLGATDISRLSRTCHSLHNWTKHNEALFRAVCLSEYDPIENPGHFACSQQQHSQTSVLADGPYERELKRRTMLYNLIMRYQTQTKPNCHAHTFLDLLTPLVDLAREARAHSFDENHEFDHKQHGIIVNDTASGRNFDLLMQLLPPDAGDFMLRFVKHAEACLHLATVEQAIIATDLLARLKCLFGPLPSSFLAPSIYRAIRRTYTANLLLTTEGCLGTQVDYVQLEAIRNVLIDNVRDAQISEDWGISEQGSKLQLPGSGSWSDTLKGGAGPRPSRRDWAGVEMNWIGTYAFLDFQVHALINSPAFAHTAIPPAHLRRQGIGELLSLELKLADDTPEPTWLNPWPTLHFSGKLVTPHAPAHFPELGIQGCVFRTSHKDILWRFNILYENRDQWSLEGVQVGQERSKIGIMGTWRHASQVQDGLPGPVGPFWWFVTRAFINMSPRSQGIMPIIAQSFVDQRNNTMTSTSLSPTSNFSSTPSSTRSTKLPATGSPTCSSTGSVTRSPQHSDTSMVLREASPASSSTSSLRLKASPKVNDRNDIVSCSDAVLASNLSFTSEIGFGNWGSVWQCQRRTEPNKGQLVATKLVHRSKSPYSSARVKSLWAEILRNLRSLRHPNIITFYSFIITPSYAIIVMDLHPGLIPIAMSEDKARPFLQGLISAIDSLHANGVTHNDIKPSNVMLTSDKRAVLIDFGFAKAHPKDAKDRFLSSLSWGTPEYLDPLRAKGALHDERSSDIWALGVTLYEIVVGRTPFEKHDKEEFLTKEALEVYYERTLSRKFFGTYSISKDFDDMIRLMVEPDASKRLRVCGQALHHVFFDPKPSQSTTSSPTRPPKSPARTKIARVDRPHLQAEASSTKSGGKKPFTFFEDPDEEVSKALSPSSSQLSKTFSPKPLILADVNAHTTSAAQRLDDTKQRLQSQISLSTRSQELMNARPTRKGHARVPSSRIPVRVTSKGQMELLGVESLKEKPQGSEAVKVATAKEHDEPIGKEEGRPQGHKPRLEPIVVETVFPSSAGFDDARKLAGGRASPGGQSISDAPKAISTTRKMGLREAAPVAVLGLRKIKSSVIKVAKRSNPSSPDVALPLPTGAVRLESPLAKSKRSRALSFSRQLQSVFGNNASKESLPTPSAERVAWNTSVELDRPVLTESYTILSPTELRAFAEQTTGTKRVDVRTSTSTSQSKTVEKFQISAPRKVQAPSRQSSSTHLRQISKHGHNVKIRASLAPSFTGQSDVDSGQALSTSEASDTGGKFLSSTSNNVFSKPRPASQTDSLEPSASFKRKHRRIPTNIRSVPPIYLTESGDDDQESDANDDSTPDSPCAAHDADATGPQPPKAKIVEQGRVLPTWVPKPIDSDSEDDADVDEPTLTLNTTPKRNRKKSAHRISRKISNIVTVKTSDRVSSDFSCVNFTQSSFSHVVLWCQQQSSTIRIE